MEAKQKLARLLTAQFHGAAAADTAQQGFDKGVRKNELPTEIPEYKVPAALLKEGKVAIAVLLTESKLCPSKSEARRLVEQGGVELDGQRLTDPQGAVSIKSGAILKAGKRQFLKLKL